MSFDLGDTITMTRVGQIRPMEGIVIKEKISERYFLDDKEMVLCKHYVMTNKSGKFIFIAPNKSKLKHKESLLIEKDIWGVLVHNIEGQKATETILRW